MTAPIVLITGAAGALGSQLVDALLERRMSVVAVDRSRDRLEALSQRRRWPPTTVQLRALDVRDADAWTSLIAQIVARWGQIDALVHCAAAEPLQAGWSAVSAQSLVAPAEIELLGAIIGTQAAARQMLRQGRGTIVHLGAEGGQASSAEQGMVFAARQGLRAFSLAVAPGLAEHGVHSVVVSEPAEAIGATNTATETDATPPANSSVAAILRAIEAPSPEQSLGAPRGRLQRISSAFPRLVKRVTNR